MNALIVRDFARRRRLILGLLGGFYCLIAVTGAIENEYGEWAKLSLFLAYAIAPVLGSILVHFDSLRGWQRAVQQLPVNSGTAVNFSLWSICVGIPTAWLVLLTLPTVVFWSPDQFDRWFSLILATFSIVFASASVFLFGLAPNKPDGRDRGRAKQDAVLTLLGLAIWLSGFVLYFRWAGGARSGFDFPYLPVLMAGFLLSGAGLLRLQAKLVGTAKVSRVPQRFAREPVRSWHDSFMGESIGWAHLTVVWLVRQVKLILGAAVVALLIGVAQHYFRFIEIEELAIGPATPALSYSLLFAATLVSMGYGAIAIEISSARMLRALPLSSMHGGLRLVCLAFAAILCLIALFGVALFLLEKDNIIGWLFLLVGATGFASLAIPCALYFHDTNLSASIPLILVFAATIAWMHIAPLMELSALSIVAPAVCLGGNLLTLSLVVGIFSRSSRAYRDQGPLTRIGLGN